MKIIFFGTPQFAVPTLQRLLHEPAIQILGVVTQPDKRRGRGNELSPSPVKSLALEHTLPVWQPRSVKKNAETLNHLRSAQADAFVVVAYGQILSQEILEMPRLGCINNHGSLLPAYRGAAPIQWSLYHGERETGITTMLMDAGMDTGPMLLKSRMPIGWHENAVELAIALADQAAELLIETLWKLDAGDLVPTPQDSTQATYAPLLKKEDFGLDWNRSAIALHNQVRGFYPNGVTQFRDAALKVLRTVPLNVADALTPGLQALAADFAEMGHTDALPGTIVGTLKQQGVVVQTGDGLLLLAEVQPAGKKLQSGWDFANGTRLAIGERLQPG